MNSTTGALSIPRPRKIPVSATGRSSRLIVVVGPPAVVPGAIVTISPVVLGAKAPKLIPDKSTVVDVDVAVAVAVVELVIAFGSTTAVESGATGASVVVVVLVVVEVLVVVVDVVVVVVVVVVAGTMSG